jgi:spore maturation protein CgeB
MRILLHDTTAYCPVSPLFLEGLEKIASERVIHYEFFDEGRFLKALETNYLHKAFYKLSGRRPPTYWALNRSLLESARRFRPDLVLATKAAYVSPATLAAIKDETGALLVNYATDDPFNPAVNTRNLIESIPLYDLYVSTKRAVIPDIRKAGCKNVVYIPFAYKPSVHFPERPVSAQERQRFQSDVVFIGGCDSDRVPLVRAIVEGNPGLRLRLYGWFWNRHRLLRRYYRGFAWGRDFRLAVNGAKIVLNLVRRANRDGHSPRSFEVLACGGFMLTDRTEEHAELFDEGKEAACFGSDEELVDKVGYYLRHDVERGVIAERGYQRVVRGRNTYCDRLETIINLVSEKGSSQSTAVSAACEASR